MFYGYQQGPKEIIEHIKEVHRPQIKRKSFRGQDTSFYQLEEAISSETMAPLSSILLPLLAVSAAALPQDLVERHGPGQNGPGHHAPKCKPHEVRLRKSWYDLDTAG